MPTLRPYMGSLLAVVLALLVPTIGAGQTRFLIEATPEQRVPRLWGYCSNQLISDWDSVASHHFLQAVAAAADSLGDKNLKSYAQYFQHCYRLLFSERYEQYFPPGDYKAVVALLGRTKTWAMDNKRPDIAAACEHVTGEVYYKVARYGEAFEHLLLAQRAFQEIGYPNVPNAAGYLSELGLRYYHFQEFDQALVAFLAATRYPFYSPRMEINTLNTIGLVYAKHKDWDKAQSYYRRTIAQATAVHDTVWVGIGLGNLGQALLARGQRDSARHYLRRSYAITSKVANRAPEDAAYSALALALVLGQRQPDSAWYYVRAGQQLASEYIRDPMERLAYRRRLLPVVMELNRAAGKYQAALQLADSLGVVTDKLQRMQDARLLSRAANKLEVARYRGQLRALERQNRRNRWGEYGLRLALAGIVAIGTVYFIRFRKRKRRLVERVEMEKELLAYEKEQSEERRQQAENLVATYRHSLQEKTELIASLTTDLHALEEQDQAANAVPLTTRIEQVVSATILTEEDWQQFRLLFDELNPGFVFRLRARLPDLSPAETRLLILTKLKLSNREMAHALGLSVDAIRKVSYRLRKRLNLDAEALEELLQQV